jgi:hypothetical protein
MTTFHSTRPRIKLQLKKAESPAAKAARDITRDLVGMSDAELAALARRCEAAGDWDTFELVRRWCHMSLDERHGVAAHFARRGK